MNEIAKRAGVGMVLRENAIPVRDSVKGACEVLGLDPLYVANEGKLLAVIAPAMAQQKAAPPDFSANKAGWVGLDGNGPFFEAVPGCTPGPIVQDPKYPFVPNGVGGQPTFRISDLNNPNLKPWVKEHMKKDNDLDSLRERVDFKKLIADLDKK